MSQEPEKNKVINLDDFRITEGDFAALALCLDCHNRWIALVTCENSLFMLECPSCGVQDSFASIIPSEYLEKFGVEVDS